MNRQPVQSSNIRSVGFEDGAMEVEFSSGKVYRYTGPKVEAHYRNMMSAPSVGSHFAQHVRKCPETQCVAVGDAVPATANGGW